MSDEKYTSSTYEVEKITGSRVTKIKGRFVTQFRVQWQNDVKTWEGVETLGHLPLLMEEFRDRSKKKAIDELRARTKTLSQETLTQIAAFPQIPGDILGKLKSDLEYVPKGNEIVEDVMYERGIGSDNFVAVRFVGLTGLRFVRKFVFEYYFPVSACYFTLEQTQMCLQLKK